jgi:starch synthase (maltosyl-transferring)
VIFLAEAFTRPKVMHRLAKLGFTQSYTYFAWRNTKQELTEYFTELATDPAAIISARTAGRTHPTS